MKNESYAANLDKYKLIGNHCLARYVKGDNVTQFDSFRVVHIPKENKRIISNKNIKTNIYRIKANN